MGICVRNASSGKVRGRGEMRREESREAWWLHILSIH